MQVSTGTTGPRRWRQGGPLFDLLTTPIAPELSSDDIIDALATGLLPDD